MDGYGICHLQTTVTKLIQPTMPTGMSTDGFFTSSARVDTQSNPMKEKNTKLAPENMPDTLQQKNTSDVFLSLTNWIGHCAGAVSG
jgi:hypothetical protein